MCFKNAIQKTNITDACKKSFFVLVLQPNIVSLLNCFCHCRETYFLSLNSFSNTKINQNTTK